MPQAVRFEQYGGIDVLQVVDVPRPTPVAGEVLVRVKAAGINPGEATIRSGAFADRWPSRFPSGQGSDLAGVVDEVGPDVDAFVVGDEVLGFTDERASQAELVLADADHLVRRPPGVSWEAAGSLFVVGTTAYAAVRAVALETGDTVVVSGAAGGVGSLAVQLAVHAGAKVIGLAGDAHHDWLMKHGVIPVDYHGGLDEVARRIYAAAEGPVDAFIDTFGADYVELALALGVPPDRIDTIANFDAAQRYGVHDDGNSAGASAGVLGEVAALVDQGVLDIPISDVYPLSHVRDAYRELEQRHTLGKIVLVP